MTNPTVSYSVKDIDRRAVVVSYHRQEKKISIADGTPVVTFAPVTRTNVLAGAPVLVPAERGGDEALAAGFAVVGANGVALPM
jgi:hypothetical protein